MVPVFSIHNEVLQNACSLAYLARLTHHLYKQEYCETVRGNGSSQACCQNEVSKCYSFSLSFPHFLLLIVVLGTYEALEE